MSGFARELTDAEARARNWRLFGSETEPVPLVALRAGPLRLLFDPASGFLRRIRLNEREVLRGIYAAVRDRNWGTVPPQISNLKSEISNEAFTLQFDAECRQNEIHFVWRGTIQGTAGGGLHYTFDGEAKSTFLRNRIGFCVLHPIRECVGARARQRRVDGTAVECRFPERIEPQIVGRSSFRDLRAVSHEVTSGVWAEVEFDGDIFEMEDQRNWTDASFKTYCTPLALPFPVEIKSGTRVKQRVTLRLLGDVPVRSSGPVEISRGAPDATTITIPEAPLKSLPRLGLSMASHGNPLTDSEVTRLRALRLSHLRADVRLASPDWPSILRRAAGEAERLGVPLELALHLPRESGAELQQVQELLYATRTSLARVLALQDGESSTTGETLRQLRRALSSWNVPIGAGSDANFCELNREQALGRLPVADADFVFWSVNPQVHAFDHLSIMETLEAQPDTVSTARAFAGNKPLVISPVTLKPRFNAVATEAGSILRVDKLPPVVDQRQLSLFAAVWTLGTLAALAESGIESVTLYETTGWRGVMECDRGSLLPEKFPSHPGEAFPVFTLFSQLAGCNRFAPLGAHQSSRVAALALWDANERCRVLLGNLTPQTQHARLITSMAKLLVRRLNVDSVLCHSGKADPLAAQTRESLASHDDDATLELQPYTLAVVETE